MRILERMDELKYCSKQPNNVCVEKEPPSLKSHAKAALFCTHSWKVKKEGIHEK